MQHLTEELYRLYMTTTQHTLVTQKCSSALKKPGTSLLNGCSENPHIVWTTSIGKPRMQRKSRDPYVVQTATVGLWVSGSHERVNYRPIATNNQAPRKRMAYNVVLAYPLMIFRRWCHRADCSIEAFAERQSTSPTFTSSFLGR